MKILENKVALITGAGRPKDAIGTAEDLKSTAAALSAQTLARVITMTCDVRSEEEIKQCVADTAKQFGQLDIVVNNAGIGHIMTSVLDCTADEWDLVLSVNLRGAFLFTKYGAMQMIAQNFKNGGRGGASSTFPVRRVKVGFPTWSLTPRPNTAWSG